MPHCRVSSGGRRAALFLVVAIPSLCAPGCVSASAFLLGEQEFSPRPDDHEIVLFDALEDVPRPYAKVARIHGDGSSSVGWGAILEAMKAKARAAGADALVLGRRASEIRGADESGVSYHRTLGALGIRWIEAASAADPRGSGTGR